MASGQQLAEKNFQTFTAWLDSRTDKNFRQMVGRGILSRKEIAAQRGFAVSALNQNPRVKSALLAMETRLRDSGVLPGLAGVAAKRAVEGPSRATNRRVGLDSLFQDCMADLALAVEEDR